MNCSVQILNVKINSLKKVDLLSNNPKGILVTPNVDHLMKLQKDKEFYDIYKTADYILCDSNVLMLTSRLLGKPIVEKIAGSDFFPAYCDYYSKNEVSKRIFILGGTNELRLKKAISKINNRNEHQIIVGGYSPPFGFENSNNEIKKIIELINSSGANVLAVGIGAPKQEKFIAHNRHKLINIELFMAIGATIDFESGEVKRAPRWVQLIAMEWLFRLFQEPKRMFRRYFIDDFPFFYLVFKQIMGLYENPFRIK